MKRLLAAITAIGITALQIPDAQAAAQYTGVYELTLTVYVASPASGQAVYCLFTLSDKGDPSGNNDGFGTGAATMNVAGTAGTCTIKIPYDWTLTSPASNSVTPKFAAVLVPPSGETTAMALALAGLRLTSMATITGVPASGTVTYLSAVSRL